MRERVLSDDEIRLMLACLPGAGMGDITKDVLRFLLLSARRVSEAVGMSFDEIDFDSGLWTLPVQRNKSKREFAFYLPRQAPALLNQRRELAIDNWVFASPFKAGSHLAAITPTNGLAMCFKRGNFGELAPFSPHDLRRTARTGLERIGVDPFTSERVLDHAQAGLVQVYNKHNYAVEIGNALQKWADHIDRITGLEADSNIINLKR